MKRIFYLFILFPLYVFSQNQSREELILREGWKFIKNDDQLFKNENFDDSQWEQISLPHDWAIKGPFDKKYDLQKVAIFQDGEKKATEKSGRTGALPYIGTGWYRNTIHIDENLDSKQYLLQFDGAMSEAQVFINGKKVGEHPYGYAYFYFDITSYLQEGDNTLAVRLHNEPKSSRWYPGAGIYRNVTLITKNESNFEQWGTTITTPFVDDRQAKVVVNSQVNGDVDQVTFEIVNHENEVIAKGTSNTKYGNQFESILEVKDPQLWSPESPYLYQTKITAYQKGKVTDEIEKTFGIRTISFTADKGFELNGKQRKFKGVCLHHDLGPIGIAINRAALKRQLVIMKEMGADAIRTAHNMPSIEQMELCDEIGLMVIAESFDEWKKPKVDNGYHRFFDDWAQKDIENLVRRLKNHPSIVMWSAGNEVPDQFGSVGVKRAKWLQDIFHKEDPTRPVTVGMDQVKAVMESGFGAILDIPGLNYRTHLYDEAFEKFPQGFVLGSETASTVSSRGVYKFPVEEFKKKKYDDFQSSSYDYEACPWSNIPEDDFILQDDKPWVLGEFVWTGFDYLGEPSPYNEEWPSRSSYFGICDLAGMPKDRFYLYKSRWNTAEETLHILPHWNWEGREGETTPVFVYTNYNSAELFINGKSQGVRTKDKDTRLDRYRLRWMDVKYQAGTVKVVAYDDAGNKVAEKEVHTAGKPHHFKLEADRKTINADGEDLSFVTVSVVDKEGNLCPNANIPLTFNVQGQGSFKAVCNGDATSLELFHLPKMKTFNGKLVVLVQSKQIEGKAILKVKGKGVKQKSIEIAVAKD
ncbi:glycoside hydrolase family 2 TIM barrel-domain containing protein [Flammeovirga pacifica]|uniref:Beta-galactosidase n=1 Tax=Flammeovirga pacifica TaxID=915059 RepID=A0A1S1YUE9_FLAPC|nr:glycoside hydrolase family 2 TIM barrel-domain containing protein [Flammeovirga pacifica]OHX64659.1 beta-galactosidase [Flammeovirga pacifica]